MQSFQIKDGRCDQAEQILSPHKDDRPNAEISLLVIHNISLPAGCFGTDYVEQLFLGCLNINADKSFACLNGLRVSSHFFIRRNGELVQFVNCNERAWHAGISEFNGRQKCNDFSIGIELEGTDTQAFTDKQYQTLIALTHSIMKSFPQISIDNIVGHSDIAPNRKTDPGECFDWHRYKQALLEA